MTFAHCSLCGSDFSVSHGGKNDVTSHVSGKHHKEAFKASSSSQSLSTFFRPQLQRSVTRHIIELRNFSFDEFLHT